MQEQESHDGYHSGYAGQGDPPSLTATLIPEQEGVPANARRVILLLCEKILGNCCMSASNRSNVLAGTTASRAGRFNYMNRQATPSLFRNGLVYTKRDKDGSDGGSVGIDVAKYETDVVDARALGGAARKTCERNGFEMLNQPLESRGLDFFDHQQVVQRYYKECEALVADSTGGRAFAFDHNVRSAQGKSNKTRITGGQQVQGPAKIVHGDYTLVSAPQRLQDLANPPAVNDTLSTVLPSGSALIDQADVASVLAPGGRFAIINVWRNIVEEPVQVDPLAMCDALTVAPEDLVTFEIHYHDRVGENYFAKHNADHQFYFFPELTRDEPLLLKQWDSAGTLATSNGEQGDGAALDVPSTFSFHSAFDDMSVKDDAPDRWSIEVRCLVLY